MKKKLTLFCAAFLMAIAAFAQGVPSGMQYQAVARDAQGQIVADQDIAIRISFSADAPGGEELYVEIHRTQTNKLGLFTLTLGEGQIMSKTEMLTELPWSDKEIWMNTSVDFRGNDDFVALGSNRLLSVPYAFHAGSADRVTDAENLAKNTFYWKVSGNVNTFPGNHFVGTLDVRDLIIKTNSTVRMVFGANGGTTLETDLSIKDDLAVTGSVDIDTDLNVDGNTTLQQNLTIGANAEVGNDLHVLGHTDLDQTLNVDGNTALQSDLNVLGHTDLDQTLNVDGNTTLQADLNTKGNTDLDQTLNVDGNTTLQADLNTKGNTDLDQTLNVDGNTTLQADLNTKGNTDLDQTLNVDGNTTLQADLNTKGNTDLDQTLNVDGNTTLQANLNVKGTTDLDQTLNVDGNTTLQANLNTKGNTDLDQTLNVDGNTTLQANLNTKGNTDLDQTLNVDGNTTLQSDLNVSGNTDLDQTLNVDGAVDLQSTLNVTGVTNITGQTTINASVTGGNEADMNAYPLRVQGGDHGVAIQINGTNRQRNANWLTLFDGNGDAMGRIEGFQGLQGIARNIIINILQAPPDSASAVGSNQDLNQAPADVPPSAAQYFNNDYAVGALSETLDLVNGIVKLTTNIVACATTASILGDCDDVFWSAVDVICQSVQLGGYIAYNEINVGAAFESGGADYAEWLIKEQTDEIIHFGEIVGVKGGAISREYAEAESYMVVSNNPTVIGAMPDADRTHEYEMVAFMGQVPTKVTGVVQRGDYILPSGNGDGMGIAVHPDNMQALDYQRIVGIAWSESDGEELFEYINVAVGTNANDMAKLVNHMQNTMNEMQRAIAEVNPNFQPAYYHTQSVDGIASTDAGFSTAAPLQDQLAARMGYAPGMSQEAAFTKMKAYTAQNQFDFENYPYVAALMENPQDVELAQTTLQHYTAVMTRLQAIMASVQGQN